MVSALKEFANFIALNTVDLTTTYARLLAESGGGYQTFPADTRMASARRLIKAVVEACESETAEPLCRLFDGHTDESFRRWPQNVAPPQPLLEIECLGQTLTPVVTNLEAGKFLWQILSELRATVLPAVAGAPGPLPDRAGPFGQEISAHKPAEQTRQKNEAYLRFILDTALDAFITIDAGGLITDWNAQAEAIFGWSRQEAIGRRLSDTIIPPQYRETHEQGLNRFLATGEGPILNKRLELTALHRDGYEFPVELTVSSAQVGDTLAFSAFVRDLSGPKQIEREWHRQNEYLAALQETALGLMNRLDLTDLLQSIVTHAARLMDTPHGYITLVEPEGDIMITRFGVGIFSRRIGDRLKPGDGVAGKVWQTGQPLSIEDYQSLPDRVPGSDLDVLHAFVSVPLISASQVMGVIGLARTEAGRSFAGEDLTHLSRFAQFASIALDNARLYAAAQQELAERKQLQQQLQESLARRVRQVQTSTEVAQGIALAPALDELFRRVVDLVQERFGYYHAHVYALEEIPSPAEGEGQGGGPYLVMQEGTGEAGRKMKEAGHKIELTAEKSLVARAARNGQPVLVTNVFQEPVWLPNPLLPETKSELAVPIKMVDEVLGVLDVQSDRVDGLTEEDQLLLMGLCGQIAVAIDNRRAEAERRQAEEAQRKSEEKYRNILESIEDGYYETDLAGNLTFFNEALCRIYRYPAGELMGMNHRQYTAEKDQQKVYQAFNQLYKTGELVRIVDYEFIRKDGTGGFAEVSGTLIRDVDGQPLGFRGIVRDISSRKQAEAERERLLAEAERRAHREQTIREITEKIRAATSLDQLVRIAAEELGRRLEVPHTVLELGIEADQESRGLNGQHKTGSEVG